MAWGPGAETMDRELILARRHPRAPPPPQLPPATPSDQRSSELCCRRREQRLKSVEWSSPPLGGTSSSGGAGSDSSSCGPAAHYRMQKVTGDPPRAPGHTSEQMEARAQSLCGDSQAPSEGGWGRSPLVTPPCRAVISATSPKGHPAAFTAAHPAAFTAAQCEVVGAPPPHP